MSAAREWPAFSWDEPELVINGVVHTCDREWLLANLGEPPPVTTARRAPRTTASQATTTPGARFLTLSEASLMIATPAETIRFWIWQGKIQAFRPGRQVLIRESDLVSFVESKELTRMRADRAKVASKRRTG